MKFRSELADLEAISGMPTLLEKEETANLHIFYSQLEGKVLMEDPEVVDTLEFMI